MASCIDAHIRSDQTVMTNTDFSHVEHRAIVVGMEMISYMNVLTKVAVKIVADEGIAPHIAKQFFHNILFLGKISQSETVQLLDQLRSPDHQ